MNHVPERPPVPVLVAEGGFAALQDPEQVHDAGEQHVGPPGERADRERQRDLRRRVRRGGAIWRESPRERGPCPSRRRTLACAATDQQGVFHARHEQGATAVHRRASGDCCAHRRKRNGEPRGDAARHEVAAAASFGVRMGNAREEKHRNPHRRATIRWWGTCKRRRRRPSAADAHIRRGKRGRRR